MEETRQQLIPASLLMLTLTLSSGCHESAEHAVPHLIKQLDSDIASERNAACHALASYGPEARPATKALIKRLRDENIGIRSSAAYALRKIDSPEATAALDAYVD